MQQQQQIAGSLLGGSFDATGTPLGQYGTELMARGGEVFGGRSVFGGMRGGQTYSGMNQSLKQSGNEAQLAFKYRAARKTFDKAKSDPRIAKQLAAQGIDVSQGFNIQVARAMTEGGLLQADYAQTQVQDLAMQNRGDLLGFATGIESTLFAGDAQGATKSLAFARKYMSGMDDQGNNKSMNFDEIYQKAMRATNTKTNVINGFNVNQAAENLTTEVDKATATLDAFQEAFGGELVDAVNAVVEGLGEMADSMGDMFN